MKNKVLYLLLCCFLLIVLTGCNSNKTSNTSGSTNSNKEQTKEEIEVSYIYTSSDNYILLKGNDNNIYITDLDMNCVGTISQNISEEAEVYISNDGYVYVDNSNTHKIYDKTGKIVFENDDNNKYNYLTASSYTLRETKQSSYENGTSTKCEIIDMKGNIIQTLDSCSYEYVGAHIWAKSSSLLVGKYDYYSDTANKTIELEQNYDNFEDVGNYIVNSWTVIDNNLEVIDLGSSINSNSLLSYSMKIINDTYFYNGNDMTIYKYDGTKVKTIDSGNGLSNIVYDSKNNKYYVVSNTGYSYIMNSNFENETNPIEVPNGSGHIAAVTPNFIIVYQSSEDLTVKCSLYDYNGNKLKDVSFDKAHIYNRGDYIQVQYYDDLGKNTTSEYYNITNFDKLVIYK